MKYALGILLVLLSASLATAQSITLVGNSIDMPLVQGYVDTLKAIGFPVDEISAKELPQHQSDPLILILGGQNAPEGVGTVVNGILTDSEKKEAIASTQARTTVVIPSVWTDRQKVMVFAGYGKEQTRKAFGDAQGDIIKSLKFNDSSYLDNATSGPVNVPPPDNMQPFTEIDAYQANTLIKTTPDLMLIDVRGVPFYAAGHIPGAVNIPESKMEKGALSSLDKTKTYLVYCGGNSESIRAGNLMASEGFNRIYRLVDGYMAWRKAGFPRERSG